MCRVFTSHEADIFFAAAALPSHSGAGGGAAPPRPHAQAGLPPAQRRRAADTFAARAPLLRALRSRSSSAARKKCRGPEDSRQKARHVEGARLR